MRDRKYVVEWHVWSSGLERWDPINPTSQEIAEYAYQHSKLVNGIHVAICLDKTGRYVGGFHT